MEISLLDKTLHNRNDFNCGHPCLNDWLLQKANQSSKKGLAATYVATATETPEKVLGYYALSMHQIDAENFPCNGYPRYIPVAMLGKLAVATDAQGQGIGVYLLMDALDQVYKISTKIGVAGICVQAIDTKAANFYAKYGFLPFHDEPLKLFMPMQTIKQLFSAS